MAAISTSFGTVTYPETIRDRRVTASLWEKNGKSRVYFKINFAGSSPVDCGFIDGETGEKAISSRPSSWGGYLSPKVSFEKSESKNSAGTYNTGFGYYGTAADAKKGFDGIE